MVLAVAKQDEVPKVTPQMQALNDKIDRYIADANDKDRTSVRELTWAEGDLDVKVITPVMAALVFRDHNGHNREFSYAKALHYAQAMERGEWKLNHQGIAFYSSGDIADGQHRCAAMVLSGKEQKFVVMPSFDDDAFDTIDVGKNRNSSDALTLRGVTDSPLKSTIVRDVLQYEHAQKTGRHFTPTVIEVEKFVAQNDQLCKTVIEMARTMIKNCSEPCMNIAETAGAALLLLRGGYEESIVSGYLSAIQLGVADKDGAVVIDIGKQFMKAKHSERRANQISKKNKLAMLCKGAQLHVLNKSVRSLKYDHKKEPIPSPTPPSASELQAAE